MMRRKRLAVFLILFLTAGTAWVFVLANRAPSEIQTADGVKLLPSCPFKTLTGLYCPGCGSTRATHFLLVGDWRRSLRFHPLLLPIVPLILFLVFRFFYEGFTDKSIRIPRWREISIGLLILFFLFAVLRNIPLACFEFLRPPG